MATSYPGAIDAFTNPAGTDPTTSPDHAAQHANANDAIEAVETALGVDPAGDEATVSARIAALPQGKIGLATKTVDQASIGATVTDISGLSVTVTIPDALRSIRITAFASFLATATEVAGLLIREGSSQYQDAHAETGVTYPRTVVSQVTLNPTAGSHTYKVSAYSVTGAAFLTLKAGATFPAFILVEDLGAF